MTYETSYSSLYDAVGVDQVLVPLSSTGVPPLLCERILRESVKPNHPGFLHLNEL